MIGVSGVALALVLGLPTAGGVQATGGAPTASGVVADDRATALAALPPEAWAKSITALEPNVTALDTNVSEVEQESTQGDETVISLTSDVLFAFGKATLAEGAPEKIAALVKPIPNGATVKVYGHTDGKGTATDNQALSEQRAKAVAAVISRAHPGLKLDVRGFGMTKPVEPNTKGGKDNPDGREKNRRVEIRYEK